MRGTACPRVFVENVERVIVISLVDAELLEPDAIDEVDDQLTALIDWVAGADVVINFRDVQRMSSALLAVVLKFSRAALRTGTRLRLCGIAPDLRDAFGVTPFDRALAIDSDEASALNAFDAARSTSRAFR